MTKLRLTDIDNQLCVCWIGTKYGYPIETRSHYPTGIRTHDFVSNYYPLDQCDVSTRGSSYGVIKKGGRYENTLELNLTDGGKTLPVKYEEIDIPCPKVRTGIKTRWNDSQEHWEKELKSGWCIA